MTGKERREANRKKYGKSLREQAYERLSGMQAFGESKKDAMARGEAYDKIFAYSTYKTYWKHTRYYLQWLKKKHPEVTTMKKARKYVAEYLRESMERCDERGKHLSAWTIHTATAALVKLFQIELTDRDRAGLELPKRRREDITRSRMEVPSDRYFSLENNDELVRFCRGTGCRRNVLERLEGRDLWTREEMEQEYHLLTEKEDRSEKERRHMNTLGDALSVFPEEQVFLHHRKDKNGRYRFAPIIGPDREKIIERIRNTAPDRKVWQHVHVCADIHSYRADYAGMMYREHARQLEGIPYDRKNCVTGKLDQSEVYVCRGDETGRQLDRKAMKKCSKALGHNRVDVVASSYLRGM